MCLAGGSDAHAYLHPVHNVPPLFTLQVLENTEGGTEGSLMASLDMCATVMGKRRLRAWLCRPMARIADIVARQDAVADLMGPASEAAQAARDTLSGSFPGPPLLHHVLLSILLLLYAHGAHC